MFYLLDRLHCSSVEFCSKAKFVRTLQQSTGNVLSIAQEHRETRLTGSYESLQQQLEQAKVTVEKLREQLKWTQQTS